MRTGEPPKLRTAPRREPIHNEVGLVSAKQAEPVLESDADEVYSLFEELQDPAIYSRLSAGMQAAALGIVKATLTERARGENELDL